MNRLLFVLLLLTPVTLQAEDKPALALKGHDPVELCGGKEVAGNAEITHKIGKYTYAFANADNLKRFQKEPEKYGIQFAGACMNMGPLTGSGNPGRYHVHKNRIYLFASDSCLKTFLINPDGFVDAADVAPQGTPEQAAKAKVLLAKAVAAMAGANKLDTLKVWEMRVKYVSRNPKNKYEYTRTFIVGGPETYIVADDYGTSKFIWKVLSDRAFVSWEKEPAAADVKAYMQREMARQPVAILHAFVGGKLAAFATGPAKVGDTNVEAVTVHWLGATTVLGIDPKTGYILNATFTGRGGVGINPIERRYSDFKAVDGFTLPHGLTSLVNGKSQEQIDVTVDHVKVNGDISEHVRKPQ